ncbi:MAG: hypothetical protein QOH92_191 [Chloroflexota bacterium]|jgi:hypothetical protein|nr:hypothetical protein [Chloroflexota bacterium]
MGGSQTAGFDIVLDFAEDALSKAISAAGVKGPHPPELTLAVPAQANLLTGAVNVVLPYIAKLGVDPPTPDFTHPPNIVLTAPISSDSLIEPDTAHLPTAPVLSLKPQIPIQGTVRFSCQLQPATSLVPSPTGPGVITAETFVADALHASVTLNLTTPISDLGITAGVVTPTSPIQTMLQTAFATDLNQLLGQVPLVVPVGLNAGPTPARTVGSMLAALLPVSGGKGALGIGMVSAAQPPSNGNLALLSQPPGLASVALLAANEWFVRLVAEMLQSSFGISPMTVDPTAPSASWSGPPTTVSTPSGSFSLTGLMLSVAGTSPTGLNLNVTGMGTASGFCWSATIGFSFTVSIGCNAATGAITVSSSTPVVTTSVSIPWYCILVVALIVGILVGLLFGVVAGVVAAIIAAIVVASSGPPPPTGLGALGALAGLPLPLPISSIGLQLTACSFDDVTMHTTPAFIDSASQLQHGTMVGGSGTAFDLDAGTSVSGGSAPTNADLLWTGTNLEPHNGASLAATSEAWEDLTYGQISRLAFGNAPVSVGAIPDRSAPGVSSTASAVIGLRLLSARYAKLAAWRNASNLSMQFVTYDDPAASLTLHLAIQQVVDSHVEDEDDITCYETQLDLSPAGGPKVDGPAVLLNLPMPTLPGTILPPAPPEWQLHMKTRPIKAHITVTKIGQRIVLRAIKDRLDVPLAYSWTAFGHALPTAGTTTKVNHLRVSYDQFSPFLEILSKRDDDVIGDVQVTATDASGRIRIAHLYLNYPGTTTTGGCPPGIDVAKLQSVVGRYGVILRGQTLMLQYHRAEEHVPTKLPGVIRDEN